MFIWNRFLVVDRENLAYFLNSDKNSRINFIKKKTILEKVISLTLNPNVITRTPIKKICVAKLSIIINISYPLQ